MQWMFLSRFSDTWNQCVHFFLIWNFLDLLQGNTQQGKSLSVKSFVQSEGAMSMHQRKYSELFLPWKTPASTLEVLSLDIKIEEWHATVSTGSSKFQQLCQTKGLHSPLKHPPVYTKMEGENTHAGGSPVWCHQKEQQPQVLQYGMLLSVQKKASQTVSCSAN